MNKHSMGLASLILGFAVVASAEDDPDAFFYKNAAEGNLAEVSLGQLAQEKSADADIKDFAAMMIADHTAANETLSTIAARKNIVMPSSPSMSQMANKAKLDALSGDNFDRSFIKGMVGDHEKAISAFQDEATAGRDPDAKAYATATLPTLQKHLKKIIDIAAAHGINAG